MAVTTELPAEVFVLASPTRSAGRAHRWSREGISVEERP